MSRFVAWLLVAVFLAAFVAVGYGALRDRAASGQGMPPYSVFSDTADGLGEAALLLRRLGWAPVALTRPVQPAQRGLLILCQPQRTSAFSEEGGIGEADAANLLSWVEAGNTLLFASRKNTALHQALGLTLLEAPRADDDTWTAAEPAAAGGYTAGVERLRVRRAAALRGEQGLPLWYLKDRPGALLLRRGKGRVLVLADPSLLSRQGLVRSDGDPRDDNAVFLYNVAALEARGGKVYFDEYHHGFRAATGFWGYLGHLGLRWALLPPLLVVAAWAWTWAVRLGPAVPPRRADGADAVDYASALGHLYQRAGARRLLARTVTRDFLAALTRHLRIRRTALPAVILAAWRQHDPGPSAQRLQALLRGLAELRRPDLTDHQLLTWARAFDDFTREMTTSVVRGRREAGAVPRAAGQGA